MSYLIRKYPRTPHLCGSRLQQGDEDLDQIPFSFLVGKHLVVEEKLDGANSAISFDDDDTLLLQSRGHYLTGGYRERHYALMKQWAGAHEAAFREVLGQRYILYGEWMYAKHSIFYDALPHYFMEFDIYDRTEDRFLDTPSRRKITGRLPVCSVPVLKEGSVTDLEELLALLERSRYITQDHIEHLRQEAARQQLDPDTICRETDGSDLMEGLYIKVEEAGQVMDRLKYVRNTFLQTSQPSQIPWADRPIVPNQLALPIEHLFQAGREADGDG